MATEDMAQTRVCRKCGEAKPATAIFFFPRGDVLRKECRVCTATAKREARKRESPERRERRLTKAREYTIANYVSVQEYKKTYAIQHKEKIHDYNLAHYRLHETARKQASRDWTAANAKRKQAYNLAWTARNKELALSHWARSRAKRRSSTQVRLSESVSNQIWFSLKGTKASRRWEKLVGYTLVELMRHLERQFTRGMTWGNYGRHGWHVDHVLPVSMFNFTRSADPDFRQCWALTNLRPLWAADNLSKGAKRLTLL